MRSSHSLDRLETAFDDDHLVANAGLLLPATLAQHLGLQQLVDAHLDLGTAPGRANVGDKLLTLIASALAGGDCIDDADALRAGGTASVLGCAVKAQWGPIFHPRVRRPSAGPLGRRVHAPARPPSPASVEPSAARIRLT